LHGDVDLIRDANGAASEPHDTGILRETVGGNQQIRGNGDDGDAADEVIRWDAFEHKLIVQEIGRDLGIEIASAGE
jgi:hypothetical protein